MHLKYDSKTIFFLALSIISSLAYPQTHSVDKLESHEILENAVAGLPQELIVDFEDGGLEKSIAKRRVESHEAFERQNLSSASTKKTATALREAEMREDDNLLQTLITQLREIKNSAISTEFESSLRIVLDYPHMAAAVVYVRDESALSILQQNAAIKMIHPVKKIRPLSNWPSSYSDVTLINSDIINGVNGHRGAGTRVVVLDTGPYLGAVPGWDNTQKGCAPYDWTKPEDQQFTESWLANGGTPESANCRIWSFYDMTGTGLCGTPLTQHGPNTDPNECSGSFWQHATVIDDVIARVAPAAYITNLQIYDRNGNKPSDNRWVFAGFDWVIANHLTSPRIVAVNYSSETPGSSYNKQCPSSEYASRVTALLSYNILTVVGTGNSALKGSVSEPACVPGIVSVGATTDSPTVAGSYGVCDDPALGVDQVPCFSNANTELTTVLAPGVQIGPTTPTIPGDSRSILAASGTSVAAPHVAAAIAILEGSDAYGSSKSAQTIAGMIGQAGPLVADRNRASIAKHRLDISAAMGNVGPPVLSKLIVSPEAISLAVGASQTVSVQGYNQYGGSVPVTSKSFNWSSPSVASVSPASGENPIIVGNSSGRSVLTISSGKVSTKLWVTVGSPTGPNPPDCKNNPSACTINARTPTK